MSGGPRRASTRANPTDVAPPRPSDSPAVVPVRVTPRASQDELTVVDGVVRVRLTAAPVEGAANTALIALLASRLGVPKRAIQIKRGGSSRDKLVAIEGISLDTFWRRIASAPS